MVFLYTDRHSFVLLRPKKLTGILLSSPEKTKKRDQKGDPRTPLGSKRKKIDTRIELETNASNRECEILIPA